MNINRLIDALIEREGGYSNHPADRGGATRWGITEAVARAAGYCGAMTALPREVARSIYRQRYWDGPGFGRVAEVSARIAGELFDTGVNMGPAVACGFLVRALNGLNRGGRDYADVPASPVVDDGVMQALRAFMARRGAAGETVMLRALEAQQGARYLALAERRPANEAFLYGWLAARLGQETVDA